MFYVTFRWFWKLFFQLTGGLEVEGLEHLPYRGPVILAPNHASLLDPWIMCAAVPNPMRSLAADDLYKIPVLKHYLYGMGAMPLKRGAADHAALNLARQLLKQRATVMIFPEGRCSPDGQPQPWLSGVSVLSLRSGSPVIPVVITGSHRLLPVGRFWPRRSRVRVRFLPPIQPSGVTGSVKQQVEGLRTALHEGWQQGYRELSASFDEATDRKSPSPTTPA